MFAVSLGVCSSFEFFSCRQYLMSVISEPAKILNYEFMHAMLYIIENGCKWSALPKNIASDE